MQLPEQPVPWLRRVRKLSHALPLRPGRIAPLSNHQASNSAVRRLLAVRQTGAVGGSVDLDAVLERGELHPLREYVPMELRGVLLDVSWDHAALLAIEREATPVPVCDLQWQLAFPWWRDGDDGWFAVRPLDVLKCPERFPEHQRRIAYADLSFPVKVLRRNGRLVILDGMHRLAKAVAKSLRMIDACELSIGDFDAIVRPRRSSE